MVRQLDIHAALMHALLTIGLMGVTASVSLGDSYHNVQFMFLESAFLHVKALNSKECCCQKT